ncbi:pseudaminic acid cytidylyltransferase [Shinella daejeonensis]|uniref:pseudaminic acid cytidylyltransferase n=1 Tax=Shinella daejeonensis TaxID=659017 RepID=UPI0020C7EC0F|nr:pseudaminic acid cytidylyltransferase [Shinella daejeonensis]MCP8893953.1 pseudaminic acid cytidylyltransferase [Shinella daejeonensis]
MKIAIIPARGGSKRIHRKNVKLFAGVPMIVRSIRTALESGCFDRVVISTDDDAIAGTALAEGAEVPFRRPAELSDDHTPTVPVIRHALEFMLDRGEKIEAACCIYATAPFMRADDLRAAHDLFCASDADYVFAATEFAFPIQRAIRLGPQGEIGMFHPQYQDSRSQDLEPAYHDAGQFYWGRTSAWLAGTPIFGPKSRIHLMPRSRVQDIDTPEDWRQAELMLKALEAAPEAEG